jgi:hypothetical protein
VRGFEGVKGVVGLIARGFAVAADFVRQVRNLRHLFAEALLARQIQGNQYRACDGYDSDDESHGHDQPFVQASPIGLPRVATPQEYQ